MVERKQITFIYRYHTDWIGGTYYILNLIKALNLLPEEKKPLVVILTDSASRFDRNIYPYMQLIEISFSLSIIKRLVNKFSYNIFQSNLFKINLKRLSVKNIYPLTSEFLVSDSQRGIFWIPDFQEFYLPHFFSKTEIKARKANHNYIVRKNYPVVFSSQTAKADFNRFFPENNNETTVLKFRSFINNDFENISLSTLKEEYGITKPFFIVPNQFWKHKNHFVVLKAVKQLVEDGINNFQVVFTGKEYDHRYPKYSSELRNYVHENKISGYVRFLGFIDREKQLKLMKSAMCVIQPSLFEGWSTVVEDVKALGQRIILSDITLHKEQIQDNVNFFDPYSVNDLIKNMNYVINFKPNAIAFDYEAQKIKVAEEVLNMISDHD